MFARRTLLVVLGAGFLVTARASEVAAEGAVEPKTAFSSLPRPRARFDSARAPTPAPKKAGPEEEKRRLKEAVAQLQSADPVVLQQAIGALSELQGRTAALAIMERVRTGLPPRLAEMALEVLGRLNQPATTPVLVELTLHRRWQIREKAVVALGALKVRSTVSVLLYALDDPSAEVRSAASLALGRLGDPRALPALAAALEHGVSGAMLALAQLGNAKHLELILTHAKQDLKASEPALRTLLARPNLHVMSKVAVVKALQGSTNPEAQGMLAAWREAFGKGTDPRLLSALHPQGTKS